VTPATEAGTLDSRLRGNDEQKRALAAACRVGSP